MEPVLLFEDRFEDVLEDGFEDVLKGGLLVCVLIVDVGTIGISKDVVQIYSSLLLISSNNISFSIPCV